ncbi:MAG: PKD domain-containing protein [Fulvivirga sp.]|nr:PKD domain-containing protein [Fulvivirga sp.]
MHFIQQIFKSPIVLLGILLLFSACEEDEPVAEFSISDIVPPVGIDIQFTNKSLNGSRYTWQFGDGNTSPEENPTHAYELPGKYTVTLSVDDGKGNIVKKQRSVTVYNKMLTAVYLNKINEKKPSGEPWDEDNSLPDVYLQFVEISKADQGLGAKIGDNISNESLPWGGRTGQLKIDRDWELIVLDLDVIDGETYAELMFGFVFNLREESTYDHDSHEGVTIYDTGINYNGEEVEGKYEVKLEWNIRI